MNEKTEIILAKITVFVLKALITAAIILTPAAIEGICTWIARL